jgi:hypothetical protein
LNYEQSEGQLEQERWNHHLRLYQGLEGVDLAVVLPLHKPNLAKCTLSNDFDRVEVFDPFLGSQET